MPIRQKAPFAAQLVWRTHGSLTSARPATTAAQPRSLRRGEPYCCACLNEGSVSVKIPGPFRLMGAELIFDAKRLR
jgi:hypothetical protein